jgi:DNA-binding MarR family transcriptional regulator
VRLDLNERTAYRFLYLAGKVMGVLSTMYGPRYGLTIGKWKVLSMIGANAPLSAKELSKLTSLEPDKITRNVDALVERGLVVRREDPKDRRRVILTLSQKGRSINESIEHVRRCIEVDFLSALNERELVMLYAILDKLDRRTREIFEGKEAWRESVARCSSSVPISAGPKNSSSRGSARRP